MYCRAGEITPTSEIFNSTAPPKVTGIHDAIYRVLVTEANNNGTALLTSRQLLRTVINDTAQKSNIFELRGFNETQLEILFDIVATVRQIVV